jgi:hypothetical protein
VLPSSQFQELIRQHNEVIRAQLLEFEGYECRKGQGYFLLAFKSAARAVQFAMAVQEALMRVSWPQQVAALPQCNKVTLNGVIVFYGPRVQIGMCTGEAASSECHV